MSTLQDTYQHKGLRQKMIQEITKKGISDHKVIEAMSKIPRHWFFDSAFLQHAYQDKAFAIGEGQTISQPYTVAFQTQLLEVKSGQLILEIGTGSGYQACILAEMGARVVTIEYHPSLAKKAKRIIDILRYDAAIDNFLADGSSGMSSLAPYDGIIVTAASPSIPEALLFQLKVGTGKLVIPVGDLKSQTMMRILRKEEKIFTQELFEKFSFVPLLGKNGWNT